MIKLYRVIVLVTDIERATVFYSKIFDIAGTRVSPGRHYFRNSNGLILACYDPTADGDPFANGSRLHENHYLYFSVSNLEATHQLISKTEAKDLSVIQEMPWGERLFYCVDPFGNPLSFVQAGTEFIE